MSGDKGSADVPSTCHDVVVMKTTLTVGKDALDLARQLARRERVSLGEAVSELVRRGARNALPAMERNGLTVVRLSAGASRITVATVDRLLDRKP